MHRSPAVAEIAAAQPLVASSEHGDFARTYSVANMNRDALDECIDLTIRVEPARGARLDWNSPHAADVQTRLMRLGSRLDRPCAEQFAHRLVLATCYAVTKRDGLELELVQRYYDPNTVGLEDLYMQECLRLGGTWEALARDSVQFKRARAGATLRSLEALAAGAG